MRLFALCSLLVGGCVSARDLVAQRFAVEYPCNAPLSVRELPGKAFLVEGCGRARSFSCMPGRAPAWCVEEGGYRP